MNKKNLIRYVIGMGIASVWVFVASNTALAVPECDCTVYNYPEPGDDLPGLIVGGECFLDPCSS